MRTLLIIVLLLLFPLITEARSEVILTNGWQFRELNKNNFYPATVPGSVFMDLFQNKLIENPIEGVRENDLQWINEKNWEYRTTFTCSKKQLREKFQELVFEGLDTYAEVYLNDKLILTAENMFLPYRVSVKGILKKKNELRIVFSSATQKANERAQQVAFKNPGGNRAFVRKAQYQFGWDFAPAYTGVAIWKPVRLNCFSEFDIRDWTIVCTGVDNGVAKMLMTGEVFLPGNGTIALAITRENKSAGTLAVANNAAEPRVVGFMQELEIPDASYWWSNGRGQQKLYAFECVASGKEEEVKLERSCGVRTIQLVTQKDNIGQRFYFRLNGDPLFIKGANWSPLSMFPGTLTKPDYRKVLIPIRDAGVNMLRVWGGGIYEHDAFYELCDSLGILVWQDAMFAGATVPSDYALLQNIRNEITAQAARLRKYTCMALWCGNNEISEAWYNWGWKKEYQLSSDDSSLLWRNQQYVFEDVIPTILKGMNTTVSYWPSSPSTGWGRPEAYKSGDVHYWGVWWGERDFSSFFEFTGRFVSEYGFQSMPNPAAIAQFGPLSDSAAYHAHQKHQHGYRYMNRFADQHYPKANSPESYHYVTQLVQRDALQTAIYAHRTAQRRCMGTMLWQWTDCWPGVSWSIVDYNRQPKAAAYQLKKWYAPLTIAHRLTNDSLFVYLINDDTTSYKGMMTMQYKTFSGEVIRSSAGVIDSKRGSINPVLSVSRKMFSDTLAPENGYIKLTYSGSKQPIVSYVNLSKTMNVGNADVLPYNILGLTAGEKAGTYILSVEATTYVRDFVVTSTNAQTTFDQNVLTGERGEQWKITIQSPLPLIELQESLKFFSVNQLN